MMINYHNKQFRPLAVSENGEVSEEVVFHYQQNGSLLTCTYNGGSILHGQLIGLVDEGGEIEMRYQQVNVEGELSTGICHSKPEVMEGGRIRLHENWRWTSGDQSSGTSIIEEI